MLTKNKDDLILGFNEFEINNPKVGDKYFGSIPKYRRGTIFNDYLIGWKIIDVEVMKVTPKYYSIAWNRDTRKDPQRFSKGKTSSLNTSKIKLWENVIWLHAGDIAKKENKEIEHHNIIKIARSNIKKLENIQTEDE